MNLALIPGSDLAQLAIPKTPLIEALTIGSDLTKQLHLAAKQMSKSVEVQQSALIGIAPILAQVAKAIEQQYQPQVMAFQSIANSLQPFLTQQTKLAQDISKLTNLTSPAIDAIKTLSSFSAYHRFRETSIEFGGSLDPDNVTKEEIDKTIEEHKDLIGDVNSVILKAESDGIAVRDTPSIIFSYLINRVPNLNKKTFEIIILIIMTAVFFYGLYSDYSTDVKLDELSGKIDTISNDTKNILEENSNLKDETKARIDSIKSTTENLSKDFEQYQDETNDKLELILKEMRRK
jgi:hypothetical protein